MSKKILSIFVLVLTFAFSTQAFASLTFTSSAITGTSNSTIDLGAGNTLSLQTTGNAPITTGTGLVTLGGNLSVASNITLPTTSSSSVGVLTIDGIPFLHAYKSGSSSTANVFVGGAGNFTLSGTCCQQAAYNLGVGVNALHVLTTGTSNIALGASSLSRNTTGARNIGIGINALEWNTVSDENIGIGSDVLGGLNSSSGGYSVAIGWRALYSGGNDSTGQNTAIGGKAGYGMSVGNNNTALGYDAELANNGNYNTVIGAGTALSNSINNTTVIGANAWATTSNTVVIGGAATTDVFFGNPGAAATVNAVKYKLSALNTAPATSSEACTAGEIRYTATYLYLCSATNTWVRSAFSSF